MNNTEIIIFSKNRTLQLKSLLRSIEHYSDILHGEISVLYATVPEIPYHSLMAEFGCNFILQEDFFNDLNRIVESSKHEYVLFLVDDLIFRDSFSLRGIERFMDQYQDMECFSLRLGKNIEDGVAPEFFARNDDILVWETSSGLGRTWKYFWELSSSIYRKKLVRKYFRKCSSEKVGFPNPLETYYYGRMPTQIGGGRGIRKLARTIRFLNASKSNRMACFHRSKCFTQGVNLVADRGIPYKTTFAPEELHRKMQEGYIIDFKSLGNVDNTKPNAGSVHFRLVKDEASSSA